MKRLAIGTALLALVLVIAILVLHAPPVRRAVLDYAIARVEAQYRLRIAAERLDYNLATLSLALSRLRVSATHAPDLPFFEADRVTVRVARSAIGGPLALDEVAVESGRVRIVRASDGTNLPRLDDAPGREPQPLPIARLQAQALAFTLHDDVAGLSIDMPSAVLDLGAREGRFALTRPASIGFAGRRTAIARLAGTATFDGRSLALRQVELDSPELSLMLSGTLDARTREPGLRLTANGTADVARLASWATESNSVPRGEATVAATIAGPYSAPEADFQIQAAAVAWRGVRAENLTASARLSADALEVTRARLTVAGGAVEARLRADFAAAANDAAVRWRSVNVESLLAPLVRAEAPLPTGISSGELNARSHPDLGPTWAGSARVAIAAGRNAPRRFAADGETRLRLAAGRWQLDGVHSLAGVAAATIRLAAPIGDGAVMGQPLTGQVSIAATPVADVLEVLDELELVEPPRGVAPSQGTVAGEFSVGGTLAAPRLTIDAALADAQVELPEGRARVDGSVSAVGPASRLRGKARFDVSEIVAQGIDAGRALVDITFDPERARFVASAPAFGATADGQVVLAAPYDATVDLRATGVELAPFTARLQPLSRISGVADVAVHAEGPIEEWRSGAARVEVSRLEATAGALPVSLDGPARAGYASQRLTVDRLQVMAGGTRLSATGTLPIDAAALADGEGLALVVDGDAGDLAHAVELAGLIDLPIVGGAGPVHAAARLTGTLAAPQVTGTLDAGPAAVAIEGLPLVTDVRLRAELDRDTITVLEAGAVYQGARMSASGAAPVRWLTGAPGAGTAPARLAARVSHITPAVLDPFLDPATLADLHGDTGLTLDLASPTAALDQLTGSAVLDRFDVRFADLPLAQRAPTRIEFSDGFARVAAWEWAGQGVTLNVAGRVRLDDLQAGVIVNGELDARMLTPFIRGAGLRALGRVVPRLSITGPLAAPRVDGDLAVDDGELRLADPRVVISGLRGRALLSRSTATLAMVEGTINGGSLQLSGEAALIPREAIQASLRMAIRRMGLEVPEGLRSEVDADLTVALTQALNADVNTPSGELSGTVTVLRGAYREPLAVLGGLLSAAQTRAATPRQAGSSPFLDNLALDVRLLTDEDVIVNNNTARLAAGGDLRVGGTASAPTVGGRVELREGGRIFLGRNVYEIVSGRVDFADPAAIRPEADIELTTRAGGQPIEVMLSGSVDAPQVSLSSTNTGLSQADLTALLVTGRRFDELASADAALIGSTVVGNLSGDVLGFAGRAVGLDTLRLGGADAGTSRGDLTALASEVDPTSRLTFGKSFGDIVDVTLSQSLREGDAQTWIVDYLPSRQLLLRLVSNDEDLRSYSLRHEVAFGAPQLERPLRVDRPAALRVDGVVIAGNTAQPEGRLRSLLRLGAGDRFDFAEWQDDRERLEQYYRDANRLAARISATRSEQGEAVTLSYSIEAGPETRIEIAGTALDAAIVERLRDAWALAIVDELLLEEAEQVVTDALSAHGYLRPNVNATLRGDTMMRTLHVAVDPGVRTTTATVAFTGTPEELEQSLRSWMATSGRELQPARDPGGFETALRLRLQEQGYLEAQVRVGAAELRDGVVSVPVTIASGRRFVVEVVRFEGNTLARELLADTAAISTGAPLDAVALNEARQRVVTLYRREGFPAAEVLARPESDGVTFAIDEGVRQTVADVSVEGRGGADADVIARALQLEPGVPVRAADLLAARRRLFDTGLFRRVDITAEPLAQADTPAGTQPTRVLVTLEQWPTLRLRYGVQLAEERPDDDPSGRNLVPGLSVELTRRTLFGRPVGLGVSGTYQNRDRSARAFLSTPTLLGRAIETALTFEWTRSVIPTRETVDNRRSVSLEQRLRRGWVQWSYGYRLEYSRSEIAPDPLLGPFPPVELTVGRFTSSLAGDSRDDAVNPSRGGFFSVSLEYGPQIGSDFEFARYLAQGYRFTPWRRVVLASAARFGAVHAFGGQDVIPSERFYTGGARSVRGVAEEAIGERDFLGFPSGGDALLVLNQEVRVPIHRWVQGVGFLDAGNVFRSPGRIRLGQLTASVGAGLRLVTPFALFRADVGRVFQTGERRWTFGVGHAF